MSEAQAALMPAARYVVSSGTCSPQHAACGVGSALWECGAVATSGGGACPAGRRHARRGSSQSARHGLTRCRIRHRAAHTQAPPVATCSAGREITDRARASCVVTATAHAPAGEVRPPGVRPWRLADTSWLRAARREMGWAGVIQEWLGLSLWVGSRAHRRGTNDPPGNCMAVAARATICQPACRAVQFFINVQVRSSPVSAAQANVQRLRIKCCYG